MLDLESLKKSINSMKNAIAYSSERMNGADIGQTEEDVLKAAVVQNFEFTYELCWKFIRRWLVQNYSESDITGITRKHLFRLAGENRLIKPDEFDLWMSFHELRNETSHTYDRDIADNIYKLSPLLLSAATALLSELEKRND